MLTSTHFHTPPYTQTNFSPSKYVSRRSCGVGETRSERFVWRVRRDRREQQTLELKLGCRPWPMQFAQRISLVATVRKIGLAGEGFARSSQGTTVWFYIDEFSSHFKHVTSSAAGCRDRGEKEKEEEGAEIEQCGGEAELLSVMVKFCIRDADLICPILFHLTLTSFAGGYKSLA